MRVRKNNYLIVIECIETGTDPQVSGLGKI